MTRRILLGITFALALAMPASVLAQAAAESALANATSAAATAKAGSALNSALDRSTKQLAGRVQRQGSPPARGATPQPQARPTSTSPAQATASREATAPGQGPMIASIQGAATSCAPPAPAAATTGNRADAASAPAARSGQECAGKPAPQGHKSVITLSFSK